MAENNASPRGIAIVGLNGSGKSTLNHMLAGVTGYYEMDVEDYYFPHQKEQRRLALEKIPAAVAEPAYASGRIQEEVEAALLRDMAAHPEFILSCVRLGWGEALRGRIGLVFWLQVPQAERMGRIARREEQRFGSRVLPGGDMYERQQSFHRLVMGRQPQDVARSLEGLACPVITLDGTLPPEENLAAMLKALGEASFHPGSSVV